MFEQKGPNITLECRHVKSITLAAFVFTLLDVDINYMKIEYIAVDVVKV